MRDGDNMDFTMWGQLELRWAAWIKDLSPEAFLDRELCDPFASWTHRRSFIVDEATAEVVDQVEAHLKPHILWGAVSLAMWIGPPLLFGLPALTARRLPGGADV